MLRCFVLILYCNAQSAPSLPSSGPGSSLFLVSPLMWSSDDIIWMKDLQTSITAKQFPAMGSWKEVVRLVSAMGGPRQYLVTPWWPLGGSWFPPYPILPPTPVGLPGFPQFLFSDLCTDWNQDTRMLRPCFSFVQLWVSYSNWAIRTYLNAGQKYNEINVHTQINFIGGWCQLGLHSVENSVKSTVLFGVVISGGCIGCSGEV